jgi:hypothetical protein
MTIRVVITFNGNSGPSLWTPTTESFRCILESFGSNHYDSTSISQNIMEVTLTTSTKSRAEVAKQISGYTKRWITTCGVPNVRIIREYSEPNQSSVLVAVAPMWVPTDAWKRAADMHFRKDRYVATPLGGVLLEYMGEVSDDLRNSNIAMSPHLILFPGLPDSSLRIVSATDGHPNSMKMERLSQVGTKCAPNSNQMCTVSPECTSKIACTTKGALLDRMIARMVTTGRSEEFDSGEEWGEFLAKDKKYEGLAGEALAIRMRDNSQKRCRDALREEARLCVDVECAATMNREEVNRKILEVSTEVAHQMYVCLIDENEIHETALRLAPSASSYKLVIGGSAAKKVAIKAGIEGLICPCLTTPALVKVLTEKNAWVPGREPSDSQAWLDAVGVALLGCSPMYNKLLQGSYANAKKVSWRRGVKRENVS